ncbi:MAG: hypothetical protein R3251_03300 [Candidatus Spechtbacterales bacterium]|nr:hypothetical protein [Candidatus Spechtbacterales bacterium]
MTDPGEPSKHRGVRIEKIRFRHLAEHFKLLFKPQLSGLKKQRIGAVESLNNLASRYRDVQIQLNLNRSKSWRHIFKEFKNLVNISEVAGLITSVVAITLFTHYALAASTTAKGFLEEQQPSATEQDNEEEGGFIYEPIEAGYSVSSSAIRAANVPPRKKQNIVVNKFWVPITAYSSTPDQTDGSPFITASGTRVRDGIVAANFLPIGTKIRIPEYYGDKVFVVEDRMNARYWQKVDIWMPTRSEALRFGLRNTYIEIIKEI